MRTHNAVNETTTASSWATPAHDAAGNMTTMPSPLSLGTGLTMTYDAWNRLVKVANGQTTIAEYQYDGRNFRTIKLTYTSGTLSETRHFYYNDAWQCLEEDATAENPAPPPDNMPPTCQYVWGQRYVDDLVLRDRDTDANPETGNLGAAAAVWTSGSMPCKTRTGT